MRHLKRTTLVLPILLALAIVTLASCEDSEPGGSPSTPQGGPGPTVDIPTADFETIETGDQSGIVANGVEIFKIETEEEWADLWSRHQAIVTPQPALPPVDFSREMVIAVVDQQESSGGFLVEITAIEEAEGGLVVRVNKQVPGSDCLVTAVLTQPFHIVRLAKSGLEPELVVSEESYSCG